MTGKIFYLKSRYIENSKNWDLKKYISKDKNRVKMLGVSTSIYINI